MTYRIRSTFFAIAGALCAPVMSHAATLFSDNFAASSSSAWTVNSAPTANAAQQSATFGFDYSAFGIPAAPGGSDTIGLRLRANVPGSAAAPVTTRPAGTTSGLSVSPTGQNFGTNYKLTFYAWSNFFGSPNAAALADNVNSQGGTMNMLAAVGTSGTVPMVLGNPGAIAGSTIDGVAFAATNDAGIGSDYRAFAATGTAVAAGPTYAAGTSDSNNAFYTALFPAVAAPTIQKSLSTAEFDDGADVLTGDTINTQNGLTAPGAFGMAWHKVEITKLFGTVTWAVNGTTVATVDASALSLGGANVALGQSDVNGSTARHPALAFTVFDNLTVESIVPEPATGTLSVIGMAMASLLARRKR